MSGQDVHRWLAVVVGATGALVLVVAGAWGRLGRPGHLALDRAILTALAAVVVAMSSGAILLLTGNRPTDALHFLYAGAALLALPIARFTGAFARRRALAIAVAAILLVALVVRLAQTG